MANIPMAGQRPSTTEQPGPAGAEYGQSKPSEYGQSKPARYGQSTPGEHRPAKPGEYGQSRPGEYGATPYGGGPAQAETAMHAPVSPAAYGRPGRPQGTVYGGAGSSMPLAPGPGTMENSGSLTGHILAQGNSETGPRSRNTRAIVVIALILVVLVGVGLWVVLDAQSFLNGLTSHKK